MKMHNISSFNINMKFPLRQEGDEEEKLHSKC